ncbi:FhaA domain-containing protein, partial [Escherichia coli]|uniref:FhaA domain-containing protein n=1 Tax=Escherichia coli TaxID=562 RepID=UPI003132CF65
IVPNLFTIELSPTDYDRLSEWGEELDDELIASALGSTTSPHPTGRTFGTRIKDYLLGSPQPTTDSSRGHADGPPSAASEYERNDERGYLDREAHVSTPPVQDSYAAGDHLVEDEAGYDDYDHHGFDDAHADGRVYSGDVYA